MWVIGIAVVLMFLAGARRISGDDNP